MAIDNSTEWRARGNWNEVKGKFRQEHANLTDDDMDYAEGQQEEWLGKVQQKAGKTADEIKSWFSRNF
jgi:uncharacterized protein YjbJ (UPF0337 family)